MTAARFLGFTRPDSARFSFLLAIPATAGAIVFTVGDAMASGEISPSLDVDVAVSTLSGPVFYRRLVSREPIDGSYAEKVVDQFLAGVKR